MNAAPVRIPLPDRWLTRPVRVAVAGAGGTGSQVVDQLASLNALLLCLDHPGLDVTVFDPDAVSESNIGRQRFCRADIGMNKADVLVHRINLFHGLSWRSEPKCFTGQSGGGCDLVFGCVDTVRARRQIARSFASWWLDCGNGARTGHVILGRIQSVFPGEYPVPNWADLFAGTAEGDSGPTCSVREALRLQSWPVNHRAAQIGCELLYEWLTTGFIDWHGALFEVCPPSVTRLPIAPETWLPFGYTKAEELMAGRQP